METYEQIKKFLNEGGKCLLIENSKPIGVVLTMEEYELLWSKSQISNIKSRKEEKIDSEINASKNPELIANNLIGETMVKEIDFPEAFAELADIDIEDNLTLEDLGLDELP